MERIIRQSYPYFVVQCTNQIDQYCVMVHTGQGFSQQISRWYFRKGNAIRKYNKILQERTTQILNHTNI